MGGFEVGLCGASGLRWGYVCEGETGECGAAVGYGFVFLGFSSFRFWGGGGMRGVAGGDLEEEMGEARRREAKERKITEAIFVNSGPISRSVRLRNFFSSSPSKVLQSGRCLKPVSHLPKPTSPTTYIPSPTIQTLGPPTILPSGNVIPGKWGGRGVVLKYLPYLSIYLSGWSRYLARAHKMGVFVHFLGTQ